MPAEHLVDEPAIGVVQRRLEQTEVTQRVAHELLAEAQRRLLGKGGEVELGRAKRHHRCRSHREVAQMNEHGIGVVEGVAKRCALRVVRLRRDRVERQHEAAAAEFAVDAVRVMRAVVAQDLFELRPRGDETNGLVLRDGRGSLVAGAEIAALAGRSVAARELERAAAALIDETEERRAMSIVAKPVEQQPVLLRGLGLLVDVQVRRRDEPLSADTRRHLMATVKRLHRGPHYC